MPKKKKPHQHGADKRLQRTIVRLLRPIEGRPQTEVGAAIGVKRMATDRFRVLGMDVQRVEIQPDSTVGLVTDAGILVIGEDDYRKMLDLQLPGGHWPRGMGKLPEPPHARLIGTSAAAEILGVSPAVLRRWLADGTLQAASTYENEYGATCTLLSESVIRSPATRAALAEKIAAYQKRRAASTRGVQTRVDHQRQQHDEYLETIAQAAPTDELRRLLTAAYLLWHLNHRAKQAISRARTRLYTMKDRMLAALYGYYASGVYYALAERGEELRATFEMSNEDLAVGGLLIPLQRTGLNAGHLVRPCFLLSQVQPDSDNGYGTARPYVSVTNRYNDYRFPFHAPLDTAAQWLPDEVRQALRPSAWRWADTGQAFTFGGRPATWVEARAIPQREIEDGLAAIYLALTDKDRRAFTALPPRPARSRRDANAGTGDAWDE